MKVYSSVDELIGGTPLLELKNTEKKFALGAKILAKLEYFNPAGSVKDRVALAMIVDAEKKGILKAGSTIIEPTSGSTGIGLASIGAQRGYRVIITMPENMSIERIRLMRAYGAEVVLTEAAKGMAGAIAKAEELSQTIEWSFIPSQFTNPANPAVHEATTGAEIWDDTDGTVDIFVAGIGTGGTLSGVGAYLKKQNADIEIIGVEPKSSPVLTEGRSGVHDIQGIGANFVPETLNTEIYDRIMDCPDEEAYRFGRECARNEGVLVGISSGAAVWAAVELAKLPENKGKTIVALLADTGERYLSTKMFE